MVKADYVERGNLFPSGDNDNKKSNTARVGS